MWLLGFIWVIHWAAVVHCQSSAALVQVDDRDSAITYAPQGAWLPNNEVTAAYNGTLTYSAGPSGSFSFSFRGISVQVVGLLDGHGVVFSYNIDGTMKQVNATHPSLDLATYFSVENLANTDHTLTVQVLNPPLNSPNTQFILDYIQYSSIPTSTTTGPTAAPTNATGPTDIANGPQTAPLSTGAIVGIVIGTIAFLALLGILYWWWKNGTAPPGNSAPANPGLGDPESGDPKPGSSETGVDPRGSIPLNKPDYHDT